MILWQFGVAPTGSQRPQEQPRQRAAYYQPGNTMPSANPRKTVEVDLYFYNRTSESLAIFNVTEQKLYAEILPGGGGKQPSWTTTTWEVRDSKGRAIKLTTPSGEMIDRIIEPHVGMVFTINKIQLVPRRTAAGQADMVTLEIYNETSERMTVYNVVEQKNYYEMVARDRCIVKSSNSCAKDAGAGKDQVC